MLARYEGIEVVAQASGGRMAVRLAQELRPDVILMDMLMPDLSGAAATQAILESDPSVRIIAFTVTADEADVAAAVAAGVSGYLIKDSPIEDLVSAISAAVNGAAWLSPQAAQTVLNRIRGAGGQASDAPPSDVALTARELEVLHLLARGLDNSQIANALSISPRTAKNHVSSILNKLGVRSRVEAAVYATRAGIG